VCYNGGMNEREPVLDRERVRLLRLREGLSQSALARNTGVSQATISEVERGVVASVDAMTVARLADGLETTMDYLLSLTDDPAPRPPAHRLVFDEAVQRVVLLRPEAQAALAEFLRVLQSPGGGSEGETADTR